MVARLINGIVAAVFLPLGILFMVIGVAAGRVDRGVPEDFLHPGVPLAFAGLVSAVAFALLMRCERERRARRTARATAEVVGARIDTGVRGNGRFALRPTVRLEPAAT